MREAAYLTYGQNSKKVISVHIKELFAAVRDDILHRAVHRAHAVPVEIYR